MAHRIALRSLWALCDGIEPSGWSLISIRWQLVRNRHGGPVSSEFFLLLRFAASAFCVNPCSIQHKLQQIGTQIAFSLWCKHPQSDLSSP